MKLQVLNNDDPAEQPWYADGLKFTCTQCGNCCTGGPGFVWVSREEVRRVAEFLKITPDEVVTRYCRRFGSKLSFKENVRDGEWHDCVFLVEQKVEKRTPEGGTIVMTRRGCSIYPVRPLQCRTWPFWPENLESEKDWDRASRKCHGMNAGKRVFPREQIESIRDAKDWPQNPPTSVAGAKSEKPRMEDRR